MENTTTTYKTMDNTEGGDLKKVTETLYDFAAPGVDKVYPKGLIVAVNTTDSEYGPYASDGSDGLNVFYGVLMHELTFAAADTEPKACVVAKSGQWMADEVTFDGAGDIATIKADARLKGTFFEEVSTNNTPVVS